MINNKGFGTKEIAIVILAALFIFAGLFMSVLSGASKQKAKTFNENALTFKKTVIGNQSSFRNPEVVYLQEVIDEGFMKDIKNALGSGNCDREQSKVVSRDGHIYITLKCGKYLIDNSEVKNTDNIDIYEVSEWKEKKPSKGNVETKTLYNVKDSGKMVFNGYYEDDFLIYKTGKEYNQYYYTLDSIAKDDSLTLDSKTFYRTKEKIKVKD